LPVRAVIEAGRGRYATALYIDGTARGEPQLATCDQLAASIDDETVVVGEVRAADLEMLLQKCRVRLAQAASSARRGGFLGALGWRLAEAGMPGDPVALDAVYVS